MLHLTLVRHASTDWNESGRFQGASDPPLSERGRAEAAKLARRLDGERWDAVFASDLRRAVETARIVAPGVEPRTDARLRELDFGAWEGLTREEIAARDGDRLAGWLADPASCTPDGGEEIGAMERRVAEALRDLPAAGRVLCVAHAGVLHALVARWMGIETRDTFALHLSACGITRVEIPVEGRTRITCVNDTSHMEPDDT